MFVSGVSSTYDYSSVYRNRAHEKSASKETEKDSVKELENGKNISEKLKNTGNKPTQELEKEKKDVERLDKRDKEVRSHESAHQMAAGSLGHPPQYTYRKGPDGKQYAVGGRVQIDTSEGRTPEETISKAQIIKRAALAPKDPSSQDQKVAQQASQMESKARAEMARKRQETMNAYGESVKLSTQTKISASTENTFKLSLNNNETVSKNPSADKSEKTDEKLFNQINFSNIVKETSQNSAVKSKSSEQSDSAKPEAAGASATLDSQFKNNHQNLTSKIDFFA